MEQIVVVGTLVVLAVVVVYKVAIMLDRLVLKAFSLLSQAANSRFVVFGAFAIILLLALESTTVGLGDWWRYHLTGVVINNP
ncbi:MAG: hypothetical protein AAGA35_04190 [Patescibacteria group bacterium]